MTVPKYYSWLRDLLWAALLFRGKPAEQFWYTVSLGSPRRDKIMLFLCSGFVAVYGARLLVVWGKMAFACCISQP